MEKLNDPLAKIGKVGGGGRECSFVVLRGGERGAARAGLGRAGSVRAGPGRALLRYFYSAVESTGYQLLSLEQE